jgi:hypothetical protein
MMTGNPLSSLGDYSRFVAELLNRPKIDRSTVVVWKEERLFWYDDFPHPDDPTLASTFPHHKHIPPDIKHNRIPAPNMSFTRPNLPALIQEIDELSDKLNNNGKESS